MKTSCDPLQHELPRLAIFPLPAKANGWLRLDWHNHAIQKDVNSRSAEVLYPISVVAILHSKLLKGLKEWIANLSDFLSQKVIVMRIVLVQVILGNLHRLGSCAIGEQALLEKMQQHTVKKWPRVNSGHRKQLIHENNCLWIINGTNLGI
ncbi:MAG: hypothetical protein WCS65_16410 [Verrucomicrobiae bacterium]